MNRVDSGNNETSFFKATKEKAMEWARKIIPEKNNEKTRSVFRKAITATLIPASAIKTLVDRIATAITGESDVIHTPEQTQTELASNDDAVDAISSIKTITSTEKIKKELTTPGSLVNPNGTVNTEIAIQTIAIDKLPDAYFENISSFGQLQRLPNIPAIKQAITELDDFKEKIISEINEKITELNGNKIVNNDRIVELHNLIYNTQAEIDQLKNNLTNTQDRLNNCTNKNDVKDINEQLKTYSIELQKLIDGLSKNHKITISKTMPNVFTGEIQAIKDAIRATNTISYKNSNNETVSFQIQPDGSDFISTMNKTAEAIGAKKSTILKQFLLYSGQTATGSLSNIIQLSGKIAEQDTNRGTTQHFSFSEQGMNVFTCYHYKPGSRDLSSGIMSYEGYTLEEKIEMNIKPGQKVLMPTEYSISKLTENESNPEKLITFDGNDFPKLTNTNAFPGNFPEYLKEPFKQLCEEINNQPQQTQSDPEASEENKTVTETFVQPTWKPGQTGHVKQVERNENRPMAATHREN